MASFQGEVIKGSKGREAVRFTTPSGVQGIVATSIPPTVIEQWIKKLRRKIARRQRRLAAGGAPGRGPAKGQHP